VRLLEVEGVVAFEHLVAVAPADLAGAVAFGDRDLQRGGDVAGVAHHGLDVDAVGDDELEQPVAQHFPRVAHANGSDTRDRTDLARLGASP